MQKRTFLITGASKGIGRALAHRLDDAGHHVVGLARNNNDPDFPGDLVAIDLSDRAATETALKQLVNTYEFDGVINNFGFIRLGLLGEIDLDDVEHQLLHNLIPTIQTVQALLPGMRKRGWGRVVNVSSLMALGGHTHRTGYAGAKAAMISFTRVWALELANTGITVNAVAPGPTETELFRANSPPGSEAEQRFLAMVPMGRFGKPEELAAGIAFMLSEDAGFITGQTLFVDGGGSIGKLGI